MKKYFTLLLIAVFSLTTMAQQKKVAVYVTGEQSGISKVLGDQLVAAFAKSGKYIAVERTSSFLAELGREQGYQRTGAVSDNDISRLGKQFGVQLVCVAEMSEVFGQKYVSSRLIDVETAEIVNTSNASSPLTSMDDLLTVSNKIATELAGKTGKEKEQENQQIAYQVAAQRQAEEERRQQEYRAQQEEYNRIKNATTEGYVQMERLYVTIPDFAAVTYSNAQKYARTCTLGGYTDWRLPTQSELNKIFNISREYHAKCNDFPDFRDEKIYLTSHACRGCPVIEYYRYWCDDKYYYEYSNGRVKFGHGTVDDTIQRTCYVILVRNK